MAKIISKCLLLNYMLHVLHKLPHDKRKEGLLFVPDDKAFISTYCFLPVNSPLSKDVQFAALFTEA